MDSSNKKYPEFFKSFLPDNCSENLRIPEDFLIHLSHKLPEKVLLRNNLGEHWPLEVAETEDGFFFKEGWSRFVSDNSLQVGDFLFFKYNGFHIFDVRIFGCNGCEKEPVPLCVVPIRQVELPPTLLDSSEEEEEEEEEEEQEEEVTENRVRKHKGGDSGSSTGNEKPKGRRRQKYSASGYDAEKLKKGIKKFLPSSTNPYFVTKLRKTRNSDLFIPLDIRTDFDLKFSDSIKLRDPEGRVWKGNIATWKDGRVSVKNGWSKLCKWNKVSEDDMLICELIMSTINKQICQEIKVKIIRYGC